MSQFTDWFIAERSECEAIITSDNPWSNWPSLQMQGVIDVDVIELAALIGAEWNVNLLSEDPLILEIAPKLVEAFGAIHDDEIDNLATNWNQTDGLSDRDHAQLANFVGQMRDFCARAQSESKSVIEIPAE